MTFAPHVQSLDIGAGRDADVKLFSYVVARDFGFAPNPFYGSCTLATCKPKIRETANAGDWVIGTGTGSKRWKRGDNIVYSMRVTEVLTFNEYWADPRFQQKKPYLIGSKKQAFGDNIYFSDDQTGQWHQENSHHSYADGSPNQLNIAHDTQVDRVLISFDYIYWGGDGPTLPAHLCGKLCKQGPGHKCNFPDDFTNDVITWIRAQKKSGYIGAPLHWVQTP